jgi:7-cyano-7-deazaguanine synthase in queuosine biosynthesis
MKKTGKKDVQKKPLVSKVEKEDEKDDGRLYPFISSVPITDKSDYIFWKDKLEQEDSPPETRLPNIKMLPKDISIIYDVLSQCDEGTQNLYIFLMERWEKMGYFVKTTSQSIVLDIPYGEDTNRLAMLHPGEIVSDTPDDPLNCPSPPTIILFWDSLHKSKGFPREAIIKYQKKVRKIKEFHTTESSAHIDIDELFDLKKARKLLNAMMVLAKSVKVEMIKESTTTINSTAENIQATLAACTPSIQKIYKVLLDGWKGTGVAIQSRRVGKIYLRMKTKEHIAGNYAQIARNFNLLVMNVSENKRPANIEVTWGLSTAEYAAYLDCIPKEVKHFEKVVSALSGFEQKGTITRLIMSNKFNGHHAKLLLEAILKLKAAEIKAK